MADADTISPAQASNANPGGVPQAIDMPGGNIVQLVQDQDKKRREIAQGEAGIMQQKIGLAGALAAEEARRNEQYRHRMEGLISAEGQTAANMRPWNAQQELEARKTDLWEQFGSPGFVIGMIASAFSGMPMVSALNAGAAAMNAINQGNMWSYDKAFQAWRENTELVMKRLDMEHREFQDIAELHRTDLESWRARASMLFTQFDDRRKQFLLENGYEPEVMQMQEAEVNLRAKIEDNYKARLQVHALHNALMGRVAKPGETPTHKDTAGNPMTGGDPRWYKGSDMSSALRDAETNLRVETTLQAETLKERRNVENDVAKEHPDWSAGQRDLEVDKRMSAAKYSVRGNPITRDINRRIEEWDDAHKDATGEERNAAHAQIISDVTSSSKLPGALTPEKLEKLGWTQRAIDAAAKTYNETGKLPTNLGSRQYAGIISGSIQNRAAEMLEEEGKTVEDRSRQWQMYSAQRVGIARFLSGPDQARTIKSLNTVVSHLDTMHNLMLALRNGDVPRFNSIAQRWAEETGRPMPTNFDTARQIVGTEVIKALGVAGAGTEAERNEAADAFNRARSPAQVDGAINTMKALLVGQLKSLRRQFGPATGLPNEIFDSMLEPETRAFFDDVPAQSRNDPLGILH